MYVFVTLKSTLCLIQTNLGNLRMVCFKSAMTTTMTATVRFVVAGINRRPTKIAGRWIYIIQVMGSLEVTPRKIDVLNRKFIQLKREKII